VRNRDGQLVPLASVVQVKTATGPDRIIRHNAYPSADINGNAAPGISSGQAQALMEQLAREVLPAGFRSSGPTWLTSRSSPARAACGSSACACSSPI
jgi:multidrug efflux pump subunit AcrB